MPLLTDFNNSQDQTFKVRVRMALVSTALAIQAEAANTANHAARSAGAILVLANPSGWADVMAPAFTVDGALDPATATDAQIESRASAVWNAFFCQG
jgi:uncharacterized phage protein gp47/JayE